VIVAMLQSFQALCILRTEEHVNRTQILNSFFAVWSKEGDFALALDKFFSRKRDHWVSVYAQRAKISDKTHDKVRFQQRAAAYKLMRVRWDLPALISVDIPTTEWTSHLQHSYVRYHTKKLKAKELGVDNCNREALVDALIRRVEPYDGHLNVARFFDDERSADDKVSMVAIVDEIIESVKVFEADLQRVFQDISEDVRLRKTEATDQLFAKWNNDEFADPEVIFSGKVIGVDVAKVDDLKEDQSLQDDDPFNDIFSGSNEQQDRDIHVKNIPLQNFFLENSDKDVVFPEAFQKRMYDEYGPYVSEWDCDEIVSRFVLGK